ncbi:MAG TPA: OmpA family protein [Micropepsaceae bacterium]|nr:OmpA family protein [Micropepsaceae bacterium]
MRRFFAGFAGILLLGVTSNVLAQPAPQLTPDQIVKALTCPGDSQLGANGTCEQPGSAAAPSSAESSPQVEICARPPDVPRTLVKTPDGDCVPAKDDTLGFDLGAAAKGAAPTAKQPARAGATVASLTTRSAQPQSVPRLDLLLTFDTDSASLTEQGAANARAFAEALKRPELKQARFEIEGHTDASGTRDHNLVLSQKRADTVKAFLVSLGVDADHLTPVGYAFDHLSVPDQPMSGANRRVVARRLQ